MSYLLHLLAIALLLAVLAGCSCTRLEDCIATCRAEGRRIGTVDLFSDGGLARCQCGEPLPSGCAEGAKQ